MGPDLLRCGLPPRQSRSLADRERSGNRFDLCGVPGARRAPPAAAAGLGVRRGVLRPAALAGLPARRPVGSCPREGPRRADHRALAQRHHGRPHPGQRQQPLPLCLRLVRAQRVRLPRPGAEARHGVRRCRRQRRLLHPVRRPAGGAVRPRGGGRAQLAGARPSAAQPRPQRPRQRDRRAGCHWRGLRPCRPAPGPWRPRRAQHAGQLRP